MRLGLLGGTFDPVHFGHLLMAEQCREQLQLDQVWFLPAAIPPHKTEADITAGEHRAAMLELATAGIPEFAVNTMEFERTGPSYTVKTLQQLTDEDSSRELFFIIGADSLAELATWREPLRILELARVVAVNRGDQPLPERDRLPQRFHKTDPQRLPYVTMPGIDLAATDIRHRVRQGKSIRFMTPRAVEMYIQEHKLYKAEA